jgi:predicted RNase H-like nuclease (RuvC/YqgF family)
MNQESTEMGETCSNCARLEVENAVLRRQIELLRREIKALKRKLETIRRYAEKVRRTAAAILSQRSGVPRGKWSYARGAEGVADGVLKLLH